MAAREPTPVPKHVAVLHLADGHDIFYPSLEAVNVENMTGREEGAIRGLELELWDDDGADEFIKIYERVQKKGPHVSESRT